MGKCAVGDAVDGPGTVVVHLEDASTMPIRSRIAGKVTLLQLPSTDFAMMGSWRLRTLALPAPSAFDTGITVKDYLG